MKKTRVLPVISNQRYFAGSGSTPKYQTNPHIQDVLANPEKWYAYGQGLAAAWTNFPQTRAGYELFESTERRKPLFNNCYHVRQAGYNIPYLIAHVDYRYPNTCRYMYFWRQTIDPAWVIPTAPVHSWAGLDAAQREAWWEMQPRFEGEVQGLNFLYELKDFQHIAKYMAQIPFGRLWRSMKDFEAKVAQWKKLSPLKRLSCTFNDLTTGLASAQLAYSFAIKPLISDILSISENLRMKAAQAQSMFQKHGSQTNSSHFTKILSDSMTGGPGTGNYYWLWSGMRTKSTFTATLQYLYNYKVRDKFDLLRRYWGLEFNAEVAWNMIPFSFLLDYVASIGKAIHRMRVDPNVSMHTMQYCESVLTTRENGYHVVVDNPKVLAFYTGYESPSHSDNPFISGYIASTYTRRVTSPNKGASLPSFRIPNSNQLKNIGALARMFWR